MTLLEFMSSHPTLTFFALLIICTCVVSLFRIVSETIVDLKHGKSVSNNYYEDIEEEI